MLVTGIEPVFSKKKRYRVRLDEGAGFILYEKEIDRYNITEGNELSDEDYNELLMEIFIPRAKKRALHLLVKQDRTESDLRKKLNESGYPDEAIDIAIDYVESYGYIDDARYVRGYILSHRDKKSRRRILYELDNKGINKELIIETVHILEEDMEESVFNDIDIIKRIVDREDFSKCLDESEKRKRMDRLYNKLLRAGFDYSDINSAMHN